MPARDMPGLQGRFLQAVFSRRFEGLAGYLLAVGTVAVVFVLRLALSGLFGSAAPFILFVPAILVAAIAGGFGPGLLALALSISGAWLLTGPNDLIAVQKRQPTEQKKNAIISLSRTPEHAPRSLPCVDVCPVAMPGRRHDPQD